MNIKMICLCWFSSVSLHAIAQEPELDYALGSDCSSYTALTEDADGNVYVVGSFNGTCDFDPSAATFSLSAGSYPNLFVSKMGPQGDFLWAIKFEGTCMNAIGAYPPILAIDDVGNIILAGWSNCPMDFDPGPGQVLAGGNYVVKFSATGNLIWAKGFGSGSNSNLTDLMVRGNEIHTIGSFNGTGDFDPGPDTFILNANGGGFVSRLDQNGDFVSVWLLDPLAFSSCSPTTICSAGVDDIVIAGAFSGQVDLDLTSGVGGLSSAGGADGFVCRYTSSGQLLWKASFGSSTQDVINAASVDANGDIIVAGHFNNTVDFDPGPGVYNLTSGSTSYTGFLSRLSGLGNLIWAGSIQSENPSNVHGMDLDELGNIYLIGQAYTGADFDLGLGTYYAGGLIGGFIGKWDASGQVQWAIPSLTDSDVHARSNGGILSCGQYPWPFDLDPGEDEFFLPITAGSYLLALEERGITGSVWNDIVSDCNRSFFESGLEGKLIEIHPGGILAQTNSRGFWHVDSLPPGTYTATVDQHSGPWQSLCSTTHSFNVLSEGGYTWVEPFGLTSSQPCAAPEVSLFQAQTRLCNGSSPLYVTACNQLNATAIIPEAYVEIQLDTMWLLLSASLPYTDLSENRYQIQVGDLYPGQCVTATMNVKVCGAPLGLTLCSSAELFPVTPCMLDTIPAPSNCTTDWDGSSLKVSSYCLNDTVWFTIRNAAAFGIGDMTCFAQVRIYLDGILLQVDMIQLAGGESATFAFPGNGQTWRLEVDQHPMHPGTSRPVAVQERCGPPANWTPGLVTRQYMNDADPIIDIFCGVINGPFDPNDKTGYPVGRTDFNYIDAGQQLQYAVRFQNTGNDTAFNVVIRDTLSVLLNAFSLVPGVASHPYTFRMYGPRVAEWTFENILLPDSTTDLLGSSGFVTFRIDQVPHLEDGSVIQNEAAIYFDFNDPVLTAPAIHVIHDPDDIVLSTNTDDRVPNSSLAVYPNPSSNGSAIVGLPFHDRPGYLSVYDVHGKMIHQVAVAEDVSTLRIGMLAMPPGLYLVQFSTGNYSTSTRWVRE